MALYIKDNVVADLARTYQKLTRAKTTTDAVRNALSAAIAHETRKVPLVERLARLRADNLKLGKPNRRLERKKMADEFWGH